MFDYGDNHGRTARHTANRAALFADSCGGGAYARTPQDDMSLPPTGGLFDTLNQPQEAPPGYTYSLEITRGDMTVDAIQQVFRPLFSLVKIFNDTQTKGYPYNPDMIIKKVNGLIVILNTRFYKTQQSKGIKWDDGGEQDYNQNIVPYSKTLETLITRIKLNQNLTLADIMQVVLDKKLKTALEYLGFQATKKSQSITAQ